MNRTACYGLIIIQKADCGQNIVGGGALSGREFQFAIKHTDKDDGFLSPLNSVFHKLLKCMLNFKLTSK